MIPISLYVIIEILKLGLAIQINNDVLMYDKETEKKASVRASDLVEELGQVEFIFSDKTGTLTQNKMEFKKCTIDNVIYGVPTDSKDASAPGMCYSSINKIKKEKPPAALEFYRFLAVCHTVVVEKKNGEVKYQATSPDELALI